MCQTKNDLSETARVQIIETLRVCTTRTTERDSPLFSLIEDSRLVVMPALLECLGA